MCLSLGAVSDVEVDSSDEPVFEVDLNGFRSDAPVTRRAVELLIGNRPLSVSVVTSLDLPERQGFGMSAAGALSASLALCDVLGLDRYKAFEAAHVAEVQLGGGLGDVSALHRGGIAVRERAGLPPVGRVERIDGRPDLALVVVGTPLNTANVLDDSETVSRINAQGAPKVDELLADPTLHNMMRLSRSFAKETGLASAEVLSVIDLVGPPGIASMSMLGNSVFAVGAGERSTEALSALGEVFHCAVDIEGPRLVRRCER